MPRIVLHIGTHKTATTSIQHALYANRQVLAARGVLYPDYGLIGRPAHASHNVMVNAFAHPIEAFSPTEARAFFAAVRTAAEDHDVTIVSAESLYRHVAGAQAGEHVWRDPEEYWRRRRAFVAQVAELFGGAEVTVAAVFRRQADFAPSLYQESVKITRYASPFGRYLADFWPHFAYLEQARVWAEAFPRLRALRFDDLVSEGDPVLAFGRLLGIALDGFPPGATRNASLGVDATVFKRNLNAVRRDKDKLRRDIEATLARFPAKAHERLRQRSFFDDAQAARDFQAGFAAQNAALAAEFMPELDLPDGVDPFPAPPEETKMVYGDALDPYFLDLLLQVSRGAHRARETSRPRKGLRARLQRLRFLIT